VVPAPILIVQFAPWPLTAIKLPAAKVVGKLTTVAVPAVNTYPFPTAAVIVVPALVAQTSEFVLEVIVPDVGKVIFVEPVVVKVTGLAPTNATLPPMVKVLELLLTPVPPAEGDNGVVELIFTELFMATSFSRY
jgi:hypothetical protein